MLLLKEGCEGFGRQQIAELSPGPHRNYLDLLHKVSGPRDLSPDGRPAPLLNENPRIEQAARIDLLA